MYSLHLLSGLLFSILQQNYFMHFRKQYRKSTDLSCFFLRSVQRYWKSITQATLRDHVTPRQGKVSQKLKLTAGLLSDAWAD